MKATVIAATLGLGAIFWVAPATATSLTPITLFDGTKNTAPDRQGWLTVLGGATQTVGAGGTTLNTTKGNSIQAGYSTKTPLLLDRNVGYTLGFNVRLLSEAHSNLNRAGFSVLVLGNDQRGIELGFWTNSIWAQNDGAAKPPRFTRGESTAFNSAASSMRYDLSVLGNGYQLFANRNYQTPILTGLLRNYSPEGLVYTQKNFLFFGDNTTSARGAFKLDRVDLLKAALAQSAAKSVSASVVSASVTDAATPVPEPSVILGSGVAIAVGAASSRKARLMQKKQRA